MARTLETPIQKRFSDVDPFQHVNNVSQQMYFDVGKMEFYEKVLGAEVLLADLRILTVSTSTSYLGQVRMHDPVRVTTTCERVGTKSLTLFQQLLAGGANRFPTPGANGCWPISVPAVRRCAVSAGRGGHNTYSLPPRG